MTSEGDDKYPSMLWLLVRTIDAFTGLDSYKLSFAWTNPVAKLTITRTDQGPSETKTHSSKEALRG